MKRAVTIQDVAARSSVSKATVSLVLNGRPGFRQETIERVQAAARELGFTPNGAARRLGSAGALGPRTAMIGILSDHQIAVDGPDHYHFNVMAGAQRAAHAASYHLLVSMNLESANAQLDYVRGLANDGVDGWILLDTAKIEVVRFLREKQIPVVIAGDSNFFPEVTSVHGDSVGGAETATRHLLGLGHRRIGYVGWHPDRMWSSMRLAGYLSALGQAGVPLQAKYTLYARTMEDCLAWLSGFEPPDRPTAILAGTDWLALELMKSAAKLGLGIPGDLSIVGFDDAPWCAPLATPALTSVRVPIPEIGETAFRCLHEEIVGRGTPGCRIALPTELVVRESTGVYGSSQTLL